MIYTLCMKIIKSYQSRIVINKRKILPGSGVDAERGRTIHRHKVILKVIA